MGRLFRQPDDMGGPRRENGAPAPDLVAQGKGWLLQVGRRHHLAVAWVQGIPDPLIADSWATLFAEVAPAIRSADARFRSHYQSRGPFKSQARATLVHPVPVGAWNRMTLTRTPGTS